MRKSGFVALCFAVSLIGAVPALAAYPRPGGATPLRVPLVSAYAQCTTPNSQHVEPLSSPSCTPPKLESDQLTLSTIGHGSGQMRYDVQVGDPSTAADEADVQIAGFESDVRLSNGNDYTGKVIFRTPIRLTDRASGGGSVSATVQDFDFSIPAGCFPTLSPVGGSVCSVATSTDALVPGFAKEGKRAVLAIPSAGVLDAGPDGSVGSAADCPPTCGTGDERPFVRQGVFAP